MRAGGFVESRNQVWRELGVFGNRVFRNAAPYLRIRASAKGEEEARQAARQAASLLAEPITYLLGSHATEASRTQLRLQPAAPP